METIKSKLPEIIDEINACKNLSRFYTAQKKKIIKKCLKEIVDPNYDGGFWTTRDFWNQTCRNYNKSILRRKHLEWVVKNIKNFAKSA